MPESSHLQHRAQPALSCHQRHKANAQIVFSVSKHNFTQNLQLYQHQLYVWLKLRHFGQLLQVMYDMTAACFCNQLLSHCVSLTVILLLITFHSS